MTTGYERTYFHQIQHNDVIKMRITVLKQEHTSTRYSINKVGTEIFMLKRAHDTVQEEFHV